MKLCALRVEIKELVKDNEWQVGDFFFFELFNMNHMGNHEVESNGLSHGRSYKKYYGRIRLCEVKDALKKMEVTCRT